MKIQHWISIAAVLCFLVMGLICESTNCQAAEKYPTRPIQVVIGFQPGGTDIGFRPFVDKIPEYLGQPVGFVYKPGAAGTTGASFVAHSKPDGYTLIGTTLTPVMISPLARPADYTFDDFVPICRLVDMALMLAVRSESPFKTLKDILDEARKSPGQLSYASAGMFSINHVLIEMLSRSAGVTLNHIPTEGGGPAVTALLGGHVSMISAGISALTPHIKSGRFRPIAVFQKQRLQEFPQVPTCIESGYPVALTTWHGLMGPKGIPPEVQRAIFSACEKVMKTHKSFIEDQMTNLSMQVNFMGPDEFAKEARIENEGLKRIFEDLKKSAK